MVRTVNEFYRHTDKLTAQRVEDALMLTDRQRSILDLFYHRRYSVGDIADRLCTSQWTIYRELCAIRSKLFPMLGNV